MKKQATHFLNELSDVVITASLLILSVHAVRVLCCGGYMNRPASMNPFVQEALANHNVLVDEVLDAISMVCKEDVQRCEQLRTRSLNITLKQQQEVKRCVKRHSVCTDAVGASTVDCNVQYNTCVVNSLQLVRTLAVQLKTPSSRAPLY